MFKELVRKNRSYRRFFAEKSISRDTLTELVDCARLSPSAANLQRIRYAIFNTEDENARIFDTLAFAAYIKDVWQGPKPCERPAAYVVLLTETKPDTNLAIDIGIAAQTLLLAATERGIGGCMFRSFSHDVVKSVVGKDSLEPELVIALGYPSEKVEICRVKDGDIKYYRDENDVHVVPKRSIEELIIK